MAECPKFAVLDMPGHARPYGMELVLESLRASGAEVNDIAYSDESATILVSLYWCEDLYAWIRYRDRNGIRTKRTVVIGGNHATGSPRSVAPFATGVYLGDGDNWDGTSEEHIYSPDNTEATQCTSDIPRRCIIMEAKAVAKDSFPIMELTRGCRYKCRYCQYAWMKPYREQDADYLCGELANIKGRVRLASADIPQHSEYVRIRDTAKVNGVRIANQDGALLTVARLADSEMSKMQRFGVDGMSERLRKVINKPIKRDWLIDRMAEYSRSGVTRCLAYNLFGLPGETREDFLEWDETVRRIVDSVEKPFTWVNSWNAFLPMPMTPLAGELSSWHRDNRDLGMMAKTREYAKSKGVNVFDMPERTGARKITERMLAIRATERSSHIVATVALKPSVKEREILKEFERVEGYELHGRRPELMPNG